MSGYKFCDVVEEFFIFYFDCGLEFMWFAEEVLVGGVGAVRIR